MVQSSKVRHKPSIKQLSRLAVKPTCVVIKDSDQPVHPLSKARVLVYSSLMDWHMEHRLIGVFAGRTRLIVGFVVRWLNKYNGTDE